MIIIKVLFVAVLAFLAAFFLYSAISAISNLIIGSMLGFKVNYISFWGLSLVSENKRLKVKGTNFNFFPEVQLFLSSAPYSKKIILEASPVILGTIMTGLIYFSFSDLDNPWKHFVVILSVTLCLVYIWHLYLVIRLIINAYGTGRSSVIWRDQNRVLELLESGIHPKDISFQCRITPLNAFKNLSTLNYEWLQYYKALELGDFDTVTSMIPGITNQAGSHFAGWKTPFFYELIYYYSAIMPNHKKAIEYASFIMENMSNDKDINGRRVYAAYLYYVSNNPKLALDVAQKGLAATDKFSIKGLAYMERDILTKLVSKIEETLYNNRKM